MNTDNNQNNEKSVVAENDMTLESAEPEQAEHSPLLRVMLAVCWTGVLAGVMGALSSLFALASAGKGGDRLLWSLGGALACGITVFFLSLADRKRQREFEKKENEMMKNAAVYKGKITAAEKHTRKIAYANQIFEEETWRFIAEYKNENNDIVKVKSGRYVNDISQVLKSAEADIYIKENGESVIMNLQTAKTGDTILTLETTEVGEE